MEAGSMLIDDVIVSGDVRELTLEELLASILLEECFMHHRAGQVVNHELEHRVDLLLGVSGIVGKSLVLSTV